jgi:hypothetical protein
MNLFNLSVIFIIFIGNKLDWLPFLIDNFHGNINIAKDRKFSSFSE